MSPDKDDEKSKPNDSYEPKPAGDIKNDQADVDRVDEPVADETKEVAGAEADAETNTDSSASADSKSTTPGTTYINPSSSQFDNNQAPVVLSGKKKLTKGKKIAITVGVIVVIILAILVGLWFWYNSTGKVLGDATDKLLSEPVSTSSGSFSITDSESNDTTKLNGTFSTQVAADGAARFSTKLTVNSGDANVTLPADMISTKSGDLYVKVSQVKQLLDDLLKSEGMSSAQASQAESYYQSLVDKVDGQWIKISKQDLSSLTSQATTSKSSLNLACTQTALKNFYANKSEQNELKQVFSNHQFITVDNKLGAKDVNGHSSIGYSLKADETKADQFGKAFENTQLYKELEKCGFSSSSADTSGQSSDQSTGHAEVWVDRWSHQFTQFNLSVKDKTTDVNLTLNPSFGEPAGTIKTPTDFMTLKQLEDTFKQAMSQIMVSQVSSQSSQTTLR